MVAVGGIHVTDLAYKLTAVIDNLHEPGFFFALSHVMLLMGFTGGKWVMVFFIRREFGRKVTAD